MLQHQYVAPVQAFADILASNETFAAPMEDTYKLLDLNPADTTTLEQYLQVMSVRTCEPCPFRHDQLVSAATDWCSAPPQAVCHYQGRSGSNCLVDNGVHVHQEAIKGKACLSRTCACAAAGVLHLDPEEAQAGRSVLAAD